MTGIGRSLFLLTFCLCFFPVNGFAETVSRKDAVKVARLFFQSLSDGKASDPELAYNGKDLTTGNLFSPFYVFNNPGGGYVVVSAENKAFPILAYDLVGSFDKYAPDDSIMGILRDYAVDIELVRYDGRLPVRAISSWRDLPAYIRNMTGSGDSKESGGQSGFLSHATEFDDLVKDESYGSKGTAIAHGSYSADDYAAGRITSQERLPEPDGPSVVSLGGGHFGISLARDISMVLVYNMSGNMVEKIECDGRNDVIVNLDRVPVGFYVVRVIADDGNSYGLKLYK